MKEINCPLEKRIEKSYLRCVNKDTLSYVDILINRGLDCESDLWPIVQNADKLSGRINVVSKESEIKYDYAFFIRLDKDGSFSKDQDTVIGFCVEGDDFCVLNIDTETNKILSKYTLYIKIEESVLQTSGISPIIIKTKNETSCGDSITINDRVCVISLIENKNNMYYLTCNPISNEFIIEKEIPAGTKLHICKSHFVNQA